MGRRVWQIVLSVACLALALALLDACAKRAAPGSGSTAATDAAAAGRSGAGSGGSAAGGEGAGSTAGAGGNGLSTTGLAGVAIPALPAPAGFVESVALRDVHFDFDRYTIRAQDTPALETSARWLATNPRAIVLIEGHADERGTNEYNLALAERRAQATRDYLIALGIATARMTLVSYGEERPRCTERTEGCWAENRRAHFLVRPR